MFYCPVLYRSSKLFLLSQSRTAARKELLDQATSHDECEKFYEESLWCLYALQDDLLQTDNPFMEEDRTTIQTCTLNCMPLEILKV
jgi:hypothetical protein